MPDRPDDDEQQSAGRDETPLERVDRNLAELLQELRVVQTGVQVLFAFLLTVAFTQRFDSVTEFQRHLYFATLLGATVSSALLIAPTSWHRLLFRMRDKTHLVWVSNRLAIAGLAATALTMVGVVMLITDVIFRQTTVTITTAAVLVLFALLWFVLPLRRRLKVGSSGWID